MKKIIFTVAAVAVLFITSCASSSYSINRMKHAEPTLKEISFDNYTVLGRVAGAATVTNEKLHTGLFNGDTGKYGSLDTYDSIYLNLSAVKRIAPKTPYDAALANAIYQLIEQADALKADAILFCRTKSASNTTGSKQTIQVTITGTAVKLK